MASEHINKASLKGTHMNTATRFAAISAVVAATLGAAGMAHAASQEEWASPSPATVSVAGNQARTAPAINLSAIERPDYLASNATTTNTTREAVQQDLKRWDQAGLRQVGAGEGGAPYFHSVRQGFAAYQGSNS